MLAGILAGAMGGGAQAVGQIADDTITQRNKQQMMQLEQQLALERQAAAERLARDSHLWKTTGQGGEATLAFDRKKGDQDITQKVDETRRLAPVQAEAEGLRTTARGKAETGVITERGANKDYLRARQNEADASESSSTKSSRAASTAATNDKLQEDRRVRKLREEALALRNRGDEAGAARKEAEIATLTGAKPGQEYDVEKVTEVSEDPATGSKVTRERTERRKPGAAKPQAPAKLTVGAVVDGYRYLGGNPNDKASWAPAAQSGAGDVK